MYRYVHHNTTNSIKSLVDVYNFRTEELVIQLSELEIMLPDFVDHMLPTATKGASIYSGDEIKARMTFSSQDQFFQKTAAGMLPVDPSTLDSCKNIYMSSKIVKAYRPTQDFLGLEYCYGEHARFSMSPKAMRKLICARVIELYLTLEEIHSLSSDITIPSLQTLYPPANLEAWRDHVMETRGGPQRPRTNQSFYNTQSPAFWEHLETFMPSESQFYHKLIDTLGMNMKDIFKIISQFLDTSRDCLHYLELNGEKLSIVRGIDHKYIPYYEQKFAQPHEE